MIRHRPQIERMESRWDLEGLNESPVISRRRRPEMWAKGVAMQARMSRHAIFRIPTGSKPWTAVMSADGLGHLHFCHCGILPGSITCALMGRQLS